MSLGVCFSVCVAGRCRLSAMPMEASKGHLDLLELELQVVVNGLFKPCPSLS